MFRFVVFSIVSFAIAFVIYVLPVLWLASLFHDDKVFGLWVLAPTMVVFLLLRLHLATAVTNKLLKAFVYYGMGLGFLAVMVLSVTLLVTWLGGVDGSIPGILALLMIVALAALSVRNANSLVIRHLSLASTKISSPKRFAFISDVHIGSNPPSHLKKICDCLQQTEIDALLIGGDLFDSSDFRLQDIEPLGEVDCDVYFITGNHEGYVRGFEAILARFPELNITVLENDADEINDINLIGVSDAQSNKAKIRAIESLHRGDSFNIALVHQPSIWRRTDCDVDLMLCGHTHNGQIYPFNLLVRLQFRYVYGRFSDAVSTLYVSSGVGCWGPRMRLGSRNEIVIIELEPAG